MIFSYNTTDFGRNRTDYCSPLEYLISSQYVIRGPYRGHVIRESAERVETTRLILASLLSFPYVYSVNVPVPGRVRELAADLYPALLEFDTVREDHSLLLKRLGSADHVTQLQHRTHRALEGSPAVEARVTGIEYFEDPPLGSAPVVYLAVESPGLRSIHKRLLEDFDAVSGLEGPDYVPHITLARGGDLATAERIATREVEPITWTVTGLEFFDGSYKLPVSRISLPS